MARFFPRLTEDVVPRMLGLTLGVTTLREGRVWLNDQCPAGSTTCTLDNQSLEYRPQATLSEAALETTMLSALMRESGVHGALDMIHLFFTRMPNRTEPTLHAYYVSGRGPPVVAMHRGLDAWIGQAREGGCPERLEYAPSAARYDACGGDVTGVLLVSAQAWTTSALSDGRMETTYHLNVRALPESFLEGLPAVLPPRSPAEADPPLAARPRYGVLNRRIVLASELPPAPAAPPPPDVLVQAAAPDASAPARPTLPTGDGLSLGGGYWRCEAGRHAFTGLQLDRNALLATASCELALTDCAASSYAGGSAVTVSGNARVTLSNCRVGGNGTFVVAVSGHGSLAVNGGEITGGASSSTAVSSIEQGQVTLEGTRVSGSPIVLRATDGGRITASNTRIEGGAVTERRGRIDDRGGNTGLTVTRQ